MFNFFKRNPYKKVGFVKRHELKTGSMIEWFEIIDFASLAYGNQYSCSFAYWFTRKDRLSGKRACNRLIPMVDGVTFVFDGSKIDSSKPIESQLLKLIKKERFDLNGRSLDFFNNVKLCK